MSLKYRIALTLFVLEAVMIAIVLWQTLSLSFERQKEQLAANESGTLELLAEMSRGALLTVEYADLQPALERLVENPRIVHVCLADDRDRIVASSDPADVGAMMPVFEDSAERYWRVERITNVAGLLGTIAVEFSDAALREAHRQVRNLAILIAVSGMTVIALLSLAGGHFLTRRLGRLTRAVRRFASGEWSARVDLGGRGEATEMGRAFNHMAATIADTVAELEHKSAEMERFTYVVSHDLKSPLVTIEGFLGFLERDAARGETERMNADLEQIRSSAGQMKDLLNELAEIGRAGRQVAEPVEVILAEVAGEARALVAGRISECGAEVVIGDPPAVRGERKRLLQVFQNLIDNAVKFMGTQEAPRIEIGGREDDGRILCWVRDNGRGIPSAQLERVFEAFERLDDETEGTGLGLALVRRVVEAHGGRIWAESEGEGRGTTFFFTLPSARDEPSP